jgi:thiosulfate dehydrogenase
MQRRLSVWAAFMSLVLLAAAAAWQEPPPGDPVIGARIYDAWYNVQDMPPPPGDHPLWGTQSNNERRGTVTWRCVTCHGWDYKGAEGVYGPGHSEYTGFPGVIGVVGASEAEIRAWLNGTRNPNHDFAKFLAPAYLNDLIAFLRTRLVNTDLLINPATGAALGNASRGSVLYVRDCIECHGPEGASVNFGSANSPVFLADLAIGNPWRLVHKTRFGQALSVSPAAESLGWTLQDVADLAAYAQTLPPANPNVTFIPESAGPDYEQQGDTTSIVIGGIVILGVILAGLAISQARQRGEAAES